MARSSQQHTVAPVILIANNKGGVAKTTLTHHLAAAGAEQGLRVLAVDCDPQGDLYRRLAGLLDHPEDRPPVTWAPGCLALYSPDAWALPDPCPFDLVVVDTPPRNSLPQGPVPTVVVVPVDGIDALLNANDTSARALAAGVKLVALVRNGIREGGRAYVTKHFSDLGDDLPDRVALCEVEVPRAPSITRTGATCRPAWKDVYKDAGAKGIRAACKWILARREVCV